MQPANRGTLTSVLTYHVVPGRYTARDLMMMARQGGGQTQLKTVQGEALAVVTGPGGKSLFVSDSKGHDARITIADVLQSNGVIHVVDTVLMP